IPLIHPVFEKHIIIKEYSGSCTIPRSSNTVTSASFVEPLSFACLNSGAFNGSLTLQFPAVTPDSRGNLLTAPIQVMAGVSGNWVITNQPGASNRFLSDARVQGLECPALVRTTNGPPLSIGTYQVEA